MGCCLLRGPVRLVGSASPGSSSSDGGVPLAAGVPMQASVYTQCLYGAAPSIPRRHLTGAVTSLGFGLRARLRNFGRLTPPVCVRGSRVLLPRLVFRLPWIREQTMFSSPASHQRAGGGTIDAPRACAV